MNRNETEQAPAARPRSADPPLPFEEFFHEQHPRLLRALYLVTGSEQESEELMQEAFIAVWERWDHIEQMENPAGYLYRVALNKHRSGLRRAARAARRLAGVERAIDQFAATDERDSIARALTELSPRQRETIVLVELLGFSADEAGAVLGIEPVTVRVHASKVRSVMRTILEERDG